MAKVSSSLLTKRQAFDRIEARTYGSSLGSRLNAGNLHEV